MTTSAHALLVSVAADESVCNQNYGNQNWSTNTQYGGLFTGVDGAAGDSPARFYLKFNLPTYSPYTYISQATLYGYYTHDHSSDYDKTHHFYKAASDDWSEISITWNNQPGWIGDAIACFNATDQGPPSWLSWDITSIVDSEYKGDGTLSLMCKADDESLVSSNHNWEYFAEREWNDRGHGFYIDMEISSASPPVPEPMSCFLLAAGTGGLWAGYRCRRRR
ncbi:MAG: DNRLRE domain-containing protein [Candidatus Zipacnadales bacterium]